MDIVPDEQNEQSELSTDDREPSFLDPTSGEICAVSVCESHATNRNTDEDEQSDFTDFLRGELPVFFDSKETDDDGAMTLANDVFARRSRYDTKKPGPTLEPKIGER